MRTLGLTLRAHRFETFVVGAFIAAALGGAAFVVARLSLSGIPMACFHEPSSDASCAGLAGQIRQYLNFAGDWGYLTLGGMVLLPIVSGLFLGIALAGKEIDRGTTVFAWSLTPSRRRWLFARVAPVAVLIALASVAAGLLGDRLEALRDPGVDPALTFEHLGLRGVVVAGETLAVFGIALAAGAVLGRILPALLIALALSIGSIVGVYLLTDAMLKTETVAVYGIDGGPTGATGAERWRTVDFRVQAPTGEILTWEEAYQRYGDPGALEGEDSGPSQLRTVLFANPGAMYPLVTDRMALLYVAIGLAGATLAFAAVDRRRP
jgi:hypothetical protein